MKHYLVIYERKQYDEFPPRGRMIVVDAESPEEVDTICRRDYHAEDVFIERELTEAQYKYYLKNKTL